MSVDSVRKKSRPLVVNNNNNNNKRSNEILPHSYLNYELFVSSGGGSGMAALTATDKNFNIFFMASHA